MLEDTLSQHPATPSRWILTTSQKDLGSSEERQLRRRRREIRFINSMRMWQKKHYWYIMLSMWCKTVNPHCRPGKTCFGLQTRSQTSRLARIFLRHQSRSKVALAKEHWKNKKCSKELRTRLILSETFNTNPSQVGGIAITSTKLGRRNKDEARRTDLGRRRRDVRRSKRSQTFSAPKLKERPRGRRDRSTGHDRARRTRT